MMANSSPSPSRRQFVGGGLAALTGFGLLNTATAQSEQRMSAAETLFHAPQANGEYLLPELPYAYEALEPVIDAQTTRLHHSIHFQGYTNGLNQALSELEKARQQDDFALIQHWEGKLAFHGAGYMLHRVFFAHLAAPESTQPSEEVQRILGRHFGTMDGFKKQFAAAARTVEGSGWAILGYQPVGQRLVVMQAEKHQNHTQWGVIPLLVIDVWEHAYYLNYQNRRGEYVDKFWQVVNWDHIEQRLAAALTL